GRAVDMAIMFRLIARRTEFPVDVSRRPKVVRNFCGKFPSGSLSEIPLVVWLHPFKKSSDGRYLVSEFATIDFLEVRGCGLSFSGKSLTDESRHFKVQIVPQIQARTA